MEEANKRPSVFGETAGSIKTLRRYYKDRSSLDMDALNAELDGESDRACIILMASILDDTLKYRLSKCLNFSPTDDEYDYVFRPNGPLGTFSGRMEIGCLFGFIDDSTYQELDIIRELRNACAHSKRKMVFADPQVENVTRRLFRPLGFIPDPPKGQPLRPFFLGEGVFLFNVLYHGSRDEGIKKEKEKFMQTVTSLELRKVAETVIWPD
jgi:hypothetical protein